MSVAVAEGPSLLSECNGESSVLLDLNAMFPSLDHEVIVTVLQAHEGSRMRVNLEVAQLRFHKK